MKLQELLKNVKPLAITGNADADITGVNIDSRKIEQGHLFWPRKAHR
jgi:UDP-N-acetylmuramoyl-L-alanyl-D-glutamate--2,6-diaminopimelate ligase